MNTNYVYIFLICLFLSSCGNSNIKNVEDDHQAIAEVNVQIKNSEGDTIGTAVLSEENEGVHVKLQATHLPEGTLAIHFHEKGVCEGPDFESSGSHFNPYDKSHGLNNSDGPHAGDLPNLKVEGDGTVHYEALNKLVTLNKHGENSLVAGDGTAIVIHEAADDGVSQPAGNAGARIACGEIVPD